MMVRGMRVELISDDYKSSALTAVLTPHCHYKQDRTFDQYHVMRRPGIRTPATSSGYRP